MTGEQRNVALCALRFAVREPVFCMAAEPVVDMHGQQATDAGAAHAREARGGVEQGHRVAAPAQRDDDDVAAARRHAPQGFGSLRGLVAQLIERAGERVANGLQQR
jgi:hypothetical protein